MATFATWFQNYLYETEKVNEDQTFEVVTSTGNTHLVGMPALRAYVLNLSHKDHQKIKHNIVMLDFRNAPVHGYFMHLARSAAQSWERERHSKVGA